MRAEPTSREYARRTHVPRVCAPNPRPASMRAEPTSHGLGITNALGPLCNVRKRSAFSFCVDIRIRLRTRLPHLTRLFRLRYELPHCFQKLLRLIHESHMAA